MHKFTTCFLGIPLPEEYQSEFETLLKDLAQIDPELQIVDPLTPHITGYYLDEQSQMHLDEITDAVGSKVNLLKDIELTVGGLGTFGGDEPAVLFLDVKYPLALNEFNRQITEVLHKFYASDNNLPFHPHMTVARRYDAKTSFAGVRSQIESRMNQINWSFSITEVVLYGVDSNKQPEHHEKLIHIPISI